MSSFLVAPPPSDSRRNVVSSVDLSEADFTVGSVARHKSNAREEERLRGDNITKVVSSLFKMNGRKRAERERVGLGEGE